MLGQTREGYPVDGIVGPNGQYSKADIPEHTQYETQSLAKFAFSMFWRAMQFLRNSRYLSCWITKEVFMGYDVSFHPISPKEMREWYFTPLTWIQQGQEEKVLALAAQYGIEDFYAEKYLDTLRVGAETEPGELFDKSHGFYIAVVQGFFRDYYYTRGSAFSFLAEEKPEYERYFTSWDQVTPVSFPNPMQNQIIENYCSVVVLRFPGVKLYSFSKDMEQDPKVCEDLERIGAMARLLC